MSDSLNLPLKILKSGPGINLVAFAGRTQDGHLEAQGGQGSHLGPWHGYLGTQGGHWEPHGAPGR